MATPSSASAICVEQVPKPECFRALCFPVQATWAPGEAPPPALSHEEKRRPQSLVFHSLNHSLCETAFK